MRKSMRRVAAVTGKVKHPEAAMRSVSGGSSICRRCHGQHHLVFGLGSTTKDGEVTTRNAEHAWNHTVPVKTSSRLAGTRPHSCKAGLPHQPDDIRDTLKKQATHPTGQLLLNICTYSSFSATGERPSTYKPT